ncbi:MAG: ferredoxin [Pirellulales bacterium]
MGNTRIAKVWVDEAACGANGLCYLAVPRIFLETDEYYPTIAPDASDYFDSNRREVIAAVLSCPTASILLEFADGRVISSKDFSEERGGLDEWVNY